MGCGVIVAISSRRKNESKCILQSHPQCDNMIHMLLSAVAFLASVIGIIISIVIIYVMYMLSFESQ